MEDLNPVPLLLKEQIQSVIRDQWRKAADSYATIPLSLEAFENKVFQVLHKALVQIRDTAAPVAIESELMHLVSQLHWQELYLTTACAHGVETAWQLFHSSFKSTILKAATKCAANSSDGHEMADSFLSDLYLPSPSGATADEKKIGMYSGVGSLEGWIKVILARQSIDKIRSQKRQVSIDDLEFEPPSTEDSWRADSRVLEDDQARALQMVSSGLTEALRVLEPQQKMILQLYYLRKVTLKEIGTLLQVHESTISRNLDRLKAQLLAAVSDHLQKNFKVKKTEVRHIIGLARSHFEFDLNQILTE
ncbi:MAG: sigma-70 family RNA polymerase sigma factor [Terriglobia bacterium]